MHYHCEIILPPTDNIEAAIAEILQPFSEHDENNHDAFYDYYEIGGRYSGSKEESKYDKDGMEEFFKLMTENKITVSSFQAGKQEISPASQIPIVDSLWKKAFPESTLEHCPLFKHSGKKIEGDIMLFSQVPPALDDMGRIIFAYNDNGKYKLSMMLTMDTWNGVTWQDTTWNGTFKSALDKSDKKTSGYNPTYIEKIKPQDKWIAVTADYHI